MSTMPIPAGVVGVALAAPGRSLAERAETVTSQR
jgi:hypothetical protein